MDPIRHGKTWRFWTLGALSVGLLLAGYFLIRGTASSPAHAQDAGGNEGRTAVAVRVVTPKEGGSEHITVLQGSVQAYESAQLFAAVSGYLARQTVDIGSQVKKGDVLAVIAVPELEKSLLKHKASQEQAKARVYQMQARVTAAKADVETSKATIAQAEAAAKSADAWCRFRDKQLARMKDLYALKSIDERLVDETQERYEAAMESVRSAQATIAAARANSVSAAAKVTQAEADVNEAQAEVMVAQAELEKSKVLVDFATIAAPFDGVITHRSQFPGDYVRAASGGGQSPLVMIEKTDLMRVVVQIPDREVPFADPGDPAIVEIDALPGKRFKAQLSRVSRSEDAQTRLMRAEIDLPNPTGKLCQGMYGRVTIILEKSADPLSIPSTCLVGQAENGKGRVYVVRDGKAQLVSVELGNDNGLVVGIRAGLAAQDQVIQSPGSGLRDGAVVSVTSAKAAPGH